MYIYDYGDLVFDHQVMLIIFHDITTPPHDQVSQLLYHYKLYECFAFAVAAVAFRFKFSVNALPLAVAVVAFHL